MSVGIIILAHRDLNRVRQLTRALTKAKCPVVIHVDAHTDDAEFATLEQELDGNQRVRFARRVACEWGGFSLVEASLSAAVTLLEQWPDVSHVCQISGSCLPTRPINELSAFLAANEDTDFVESVPARGEGRAWVVDGLEMERFTLHFPFSYRRQRWLFDKAVDLQRKFRIRRQIPIGLEPHLGSQWWCLSRATLEAILNSPDRAEYDRYFKRCWIPDEAYFPTLVRLFGQKVVSRSLTLSRFDDQGKPYIFYDDHKELLANCDAFFARKVWAGADHLYRDLLSHKRLASGPRKVRDDRDPGVLETAFRNSYDKRCAARPGLLNQGRFPAAVYTGSAPTAAPYTVLQGFTHVYEHFPGWMRDQRGEASLGRLYKRNAVGRIDPEHVLPGGLPASVRFRDYNPEQYLVNLIWNMRAAPPILLHDIADSPRISTFLARDPNARLTLITGAWALDLFHRQIEDDRVLRRSALRLISQEQLQLVRLDKGENPNAVHVTLADAMMLPERVLGTALGVSDLGALPGLRNHDGFEDFVERLENFGLNMDSLGDIGAFARGVSAPPALRIVADG